MRASDVLSVLRACGEHVPTWLWGPPGIGKSDIVREWGESVGEVRDLRACLLESVDLRGLPKLLDDTAVWLPPSFLPRAGRGVLFLDELAQAPIPVQNACLQLALDRKVGEYNLPEGWHVVAASNRVEDRAGANRVTSALLSRFLHLDLEVSNEDWQAWAIPADICPEVRSFLHFKPSLLHAFEAKDRSSPSPRSWEFVSRLQDKAPSACHRDVVSGLIGPGAAAEYIAYCKTYASLPDLNDIIANPKRVKLPTELSVTHAVIGALCERFRQNDAKVAGAISTFFNRLPVEFGAVAYKTGFAIWRDLAKVPEAREFFSKNHEVIMG